MTILINVDEWSICNWPALGSLGERSPGLPPILLMREERALPTSLQRVISVMVANQPDGGTSAWGTLSFHRLSETVFANQGIGRVGGNALSCLPLIGCPDRVHLACNPEACGALSGGQGGETTPCVSEEETDCALAHTSQASPPQVEDGHHYHRHPRGGA